VASNDEDRIDTAVGTPANGRIARVSLARA
jgi:hypothetical protein